MRMSRAAAGLQEAPVSACPSCGRESRTVQGVCADCWGAKDETAARRPAGRTEPFGIFDFDWEDPLVLLAAAAVVGAVGSSILWLVFG